MASLSIRLVELKKSRNLLQIDIAKDLDVSIRAYRNYEKGQRSPDSDLIIKMSKYFGVSTDYLLGLTDNPEINK